MNSKTLSKDEKNKLLKGIEDDIDDIRYFKRKFDLQYLTDRDIQLLYRALGDAWLIMSQVTTDEYAEVWDKAEKDEERRKRFNKP